MTRPASNSDAGRFELIAGPMFSGKSEELLRRVRRAAIAKRRVTLVKPALDERFAAAEIVSHAGRAMGAAVVKEPREILALAHEADVVAIDEVQFFGHEIVSIIEGLLVDAVDVVAAGVNLDFRGQPWGVMPTLLCLADEVDKLQAVCELCGADASFSQRLAEGAPASMDDETVVVGGHELYQARCRGCYEPPPTAATSSQTA